MGPHTAERRYSIRELRLYAVAHGYTAEAEALDRHAANQRAEPSPLWQQAAAAALTRLPRPA